MFGNFQVKQSKDIERSSLDLETDRQLQNNMLPFKKRARNIHVDNITQKSDLRAPLINQIDTVNPVFFFDFKVCFISNT